ncbi:MAG TPA: hypothetical protein VGM21_12835 [Actinomycetota bacterium]|jgi:hypothetical protein
MPLRGWERAGAAVGIAAVVLLFVGEVLGGDDVHPTATDSGQHVTAFYAANHAGVLAGSYVHGVALMLLLWFAATLAGVVRAGGQDAMATLIATASAVTAGVVGLWLVVTATLAFGAGPGQDPGAAQVLYQLRYLAQTFWSLPVAALTGATAVGVLRGRVLPRWHGWFSAATALAFLLGGTDMARTGLFAADGDYGFLLFWLLPLWLVVISIGLLRSPRAAHDAAAAPITTPVP